MLTGMDSSQYQHCCQEIWFTNLESKQVEVIEFFLLISNDAFVVSLIEYGNHLYYTVPCLPLVFNLMNKTEALS